MKRYRWALLVLFFGLPRAVSGQEITRTTYLERPHYLIETASATCLYDIRGGGFSSIRDLSGTEWIGFKPGNGEYPASAAADYRGLPNLVFRGEDNGSGHPGFDQCISIQEGANVIHTTTRSGSWEWKWTFRDEGALLEILKTDTSRCYWFLYEGTPGGRFLPPEQYWGTSADGIRQDTPVLGHPAAGNWKWAFFGDQNHETALYIIHLTPDTLTDNFSYMGNTIEGTAAPDGMVVFGLGRSGATPLMKGPNRFYIGFHPLDIHNQNSFDRFRKHVESIRDQYVHW